MIITGMHRWEHLMTLLDRKRETQVSSLSSPCFLVNCTSLLTPSHDLILDQYPRDDRELACPHRTLLAGHLSIHLHV